MEKTWFWLVVAMLVTAATFSVVNSVTTESVPCVIEGTYVADMSADLCERTRLYGEFMEEEKRRGFSK